MKATITATLSPRDWVRVIHAVDSSMTRKAKRGDRDGASEMELIGPRADQAMPAATRRREAKGRRTMISLGKGVFTWGRMERVSDRYGAVYLIPEGSSSLTTAATPSLISIPPEAEGLGTLWAVVTETRASTHIGDLFRGFSPSTPKVGAKIKLGTGKFFSEPAPGDEGGLAVGLRPADGRNSDWLNPKALYQAHEQSVEMFFEPESKK